MSAFTITGGHVVDPAEGIDRPMDVVIQDGRIAELLAPSKNGAAKRNGRKFNAAGLLVVPGLIDLHTHLREPGREDKETIETGLQAAVRGGFTAVCAMPNTDPAMDHRGVVELVAGEAGRVGLAAVYPVGAISRGRQGKELTDFGELFEAGCVALSDDGNPLADSLLMRRALEYVRVYGRPIIQHAEDPRLSVGGVMHEGLVSTTLGLRGIPSESEAVIVARDVALADLTGGWVHFAHLSCSQSVEIVRQAKQRGVRVTCEVTPHHLTLTHEAVGTFDARAKVNPPLRTEEDRQALIDGLADGTIDCIATDHAPHTAWEKDAEFDAAPFGIAGLETALAVCATELVSGGHLNWSGLVEKLSTNPARLVGSGGTLKAGAVADIAVIDPQARWTIDAAGFASKAKLTPFQGREVQGRVTAVFRLGAIVFGEGSP